MAEQQNRPFSRASLPVGQRVALRIEYDGSGFSGWQIQPQSSAAATVQGELQSALCAIADAPVTVHCAGRTDTGVHATAQWVHFDAPVSRSIKDWVVGGNAQLPPTVRIADGQAVAKRFHARHSAIMRSYDYLIANTPIAPSLLAFRALWCREELDAQRMHRALQEILGERDFSAFRAASCQSRTPMRFMVRAAVHRSAAGYVQVRVTANAFLHHMVRNIVGSLIEVGRGRQPESWLGELLRRGDRCAAAATASAQGLYLTQVHYAEEDAIPLAGPLPFLADLSAEDGDRAAASRLSEIARSTFARDRQDERTGD